MHYRPLLTKTFPAGRLALGVSLLLAVAMALSASGCSRDSATVVSPVATVVPPEATPTATASPPSAAGTPTTAFSPDVPLDDAEPPALDLLDLSVRLGRTPAEARSVTPPPAAPVRTMGQVDTFWVSDQIEDRIYTVEATLRLVSEHAYWYVDNSVVVPDEDIRQVAGMFERQVRPIIVASIGDIRSPGLDGDPRLTVLNTPLNSLGGYFGARDEFPRAVHPTSNEREMVYMDTGVLLGGLDSYMGVLAHEFQHAVHANLDGDEDSWLNEGMSEVARELAIGPSEFVESFLDSSSIQLDYWPDRPNDTTPHYGASVLFLSYLADHYGGTEGVGNLARLRSNGARSVDEYLAAYGRTFENVFADWVVANYLDEPDGPYSYPDRNVQIRDAEFVPAFDELERTTPQFAASYFELGMTGDIELEFTGDQKVRQVDTICRSGKRCWWGNRGDAKDTRLTHEFDLRGLEKATLKFAVWHSIEDGWDYAYVEVSTDGGTSWRILPGIHTTDHDPIGNAFGVGYTGDSGEWLQEQVDLSDYTGQKVLVRFEYVTDDAVYLDGIVLDDIAIPELGFLDDAEGDAGWTAEGFQRITTVLEQRFIVQLIQRFDDGTTDVHTLVLDPENHVQAFLEGLGERVTEAVLVVSPITRDTHQPAGYTLSIGPVE